MSRTELLADAGKAFLGLHPDDATSFAQANESARQTLAPFVWEGRFRRSGETIWMHIELTRD